MSEQNPSNEDNESIVFDEKKFNRTITIKNVLTPLSIITFAIFMILYMVSGLTSYDGFIEYFIDTYARYFGLIFIIFGFICIQNYSMYLQTNKSGGFLISGIISMAFGLMTFMGLPIFTSMPINTKYDNVYKETTMKVDDIDSFSSGGFFLSLPMQKVFSGNFSFNAPFDKFSKGDEFIVKYSRSKDEFMEKVSVCEVGSKYCILLEKNLVEK